MARAAAAVELLGREQLALVTERLELQRVTGGVTEEHRRLLSRRPDEPDLWRDEELDPSTAQAVGEVVPVPPLKHHAKVWDRDVVTVDRVDVACWELGGLYEVCDDLMPEQVEVDPPITRPPNPATEVVHIEPARGGEVVDREGVVERR